MATGASENADTVINVYDMRSRIGDLESSMAIHRQDVSELAEPLSGLHERVHDLEVKLSVTEVKLQTSVDLTDDLVATANNVLAHTDNVLTHSDSLLTTYFFAITISVTVIMFLLQLWLNKRRAEHIQSLKDEHKTDLQTMRQDHDSDLQAMRSDHRQEMTELIADHKQELTDQVGKVENAFIEKLTRDENFLTSVTAPILKNTDFISRLAGTAQDLMDQADDVPDDVGDQADIHELGANIEKE